MKNTSTDIISCEKTIFDKKIIWRKGDDARQLRKNRQIESLQSENLPDYYLC